MSAIQLFSFQEKEIRTTMVGRDAWFSAMDVFKALGLTWTSARDLRERQIPENWTLKVGGITSQGIRDMVYISEQAVYMLAFRANKNEQAITFTKWVADVLVKIRKGSHIQFAGHGDRDHLQLNVQKQNSKAINAIMFLQGDVEAIKKHNIINCEVHTGKRPSEIREIGKNLGLKSKERSSAKEVLRKIRPEFAASMSMADQLTGENGIDSKVAAETCKKYALPLYQQLIAIGAESAVRRQYE